MYPEKEEGMPIRLVAKPVGVDSADDPAYPVAREAGMKSWIIALLGE